MTTKVLFLIEHAAEVAPHNVFAYFPEDVFDSKGNKTCYAHIGQHSACHPDYAAECKEADFNLYCFDLLPELIRIGYKDLQIMNWQEVEYHRKPTKGEIKFGYGGTFYRSFTLAKIGLNKKGDLKSWFLCEDDGLRYYR